jgi:hypothetical protein
MDTDGGGAQLNCSSTAATSSMDSRGMSTPAGDVTSISRIVCRAGRTNAPAWACDEIEGTLVGTCGRHIPKVG